MFCATLREDAVAEPLGGLLVEDTLALEHTEGIGIEHFGPLVGIVSGRITTRHDVGELYCHTRLGKLFTKDGFFPGSLFEGDDVVCELVLLCIVSHIEQSQADLSQTGCGSHEVAASDNALDEHVG